MKAAEAGEIRALASGVLPTFRIIDANNPLEPRCSSRMPNERRVTKARKGPDRPGSRCARPVRPACGLDGAPLARLSLPRDRGLPCAIALKLQRKCKLRAL